MVVTGPALAQDDARVIARGLEIYKRKAACLFCHAWHGGGERSQYGGIALSLRDTALTAEQIHEVVQCGRPGTGMPYHDRFAYTDDRCYGMTAADLGDDMPEQPLDFLNDREIDAVVAYVVATYKGKGEPGLAECEAFWGGDSRVCDPYR